MRELTFERIATGVKELCVEAAYQLPADVVQALQDYRGREESPIGKKVLGELVENARIAGAGEYPLCQDCGFAVFIVELGNDVHVTGGSLADAVTEGVRRGYGEGYLRKSIVVHPVVGKNTGDNTPPVIHVVPTAGDKLVIHFAPKGGGSENMSRLKMMRPADGREGIIAFVEETVREAGSNPCPPLVVGVGIGGTFEYCAFLAKKALFRPLGQPARDEWDAALEKELLERINRLGIGPMGYGGTTTALAVHVESFGRHIASFPCAVNINCHSARHKTAVL
jgi:fumarate hydratase subunit alpha